MQLPFSEANAVPFIRPTRPTGNQSATAAHALSRAVVHAVEMAFNPMAQPDSPSPMPTLDQTTLDQTTLDSSTLDQGTLEKAEPLEVVKQTIDELEAQGLLMVFDRHDQVAKRLTGNLIAAGVLPEDMPSST